MTKLTLLFDGTTGGAGAPMWLTATASLDGETLDSDVFTITVNY